MWHIVCNLVFFIVEFSFFFFIFFPAHFDDFNVETVASAVENKGEIKSNGNNSERDDGGENGEGDEIF